MDAVALEAAVAEDLPALHPGEGVLEAGAGLAVGGAVSLSPDREFGPAFLAAVRDDQPGAPVAAVGDDGGVANRGFRTGQLPCLAVVSVAGQRSADGDDQAGVGIDDDLVVGGVPITLRLLGDGVVAGGHQGAVNDQHGVLPEPPALLEGKGGAEVVDNAVGGRLRHPEQRRKLSQREVGPPVRGNEQDPVLQRQAPGPAFADRVRALTPQRGDQLAELTSAQPSKRGYPGRLQHRDHTGHSKIISTVTSSYGTALSGGPSPGSPAV